MTDTGASARITHFFVSDGDERTLISMFVAARDITRNTKGDPVDILNDLRAGRTVVVGERTYTPRAPDPDSDDLYWQAPDVTVRVMPHDPWDRATDALWEGRWALELWHPFHSWQTIGVYDTQAEADTAAALYLEHETADE